MKRTSAAIVLWVSASVVSPYADITVHRNIAYDQIAGVDQRLLSLDIYEPNPSSGNYPVIVYVHGGTWQGGDKGVVRYKDDHFVSSGYVFVSVNYRLSPACPPCDTLSQDAVRFPIHPRDVGTALAWVYNNIAGYGGDPSRIGLLGHSAGAHLVALVATDESYLATHGLSLSILTCVCPLDGAVYHLPRQIAFSGEDSGYTLALKNAFGTDPELWDDASPAFQVRADRGVPPFLLVHQNVTSRIVQNSLLRDSLLNCGKSASTFGIELTHGEINILVGLTDKDEYDSMVAQSATPPSPNAYELGLQLTDTVTSFFAEHLTSTVTSRPASPRVPARDGARMQAVVAYDCMGRRMSADDMRAVRRESGVLLIPARNGSVLLLGTCR